MSLLDQLKSKKSSLKATTTTVRYADGKQYTTDNGGKEVPINSISYGFVVDTAPDIEPACILDNFLYIGSQDAVNPDNIEKYNLTNILSIGISTPYIETDRKLSNLFIPCLDLPDTELKNVVEQANVFLRNVHKNNGAVLVHCNAGVSRSSSVVIGYLIMALKMTFREAYELVKSKRPSCCPNAGFIDQLKKL